MAITFDVAIGNTGTSTSSNAALNHAAQAQILVFVGYSGTTSPSSVTIGAGNTALTYLTNSKVSYSTATSMEVWYIFRPSSGNETVTVNFAGNTRHAWSAVSYTGVAVDQFENLNTNNGTSSSPASATCNVVAGTTGRMCVSGVVGRDSAKGAYTITIAPANSEQERDERDLAGGSGGGVWAVSTQAQEYNTALAHSMNATLTCAGRTLYWAETALGLKPNVPQTVTLNAATLTSAAQGVTATAPPAPTTVTVLVTTLTASGQNLTVVPGDKTTTINVVTVTSLAQVVTTYEAHTVILNASVVAAQAQVINEIPGAITISINASSLSINAQAVNILLVDNSGIKSKVGSFNIDTAKTVGQTQSVAGIGFQPKLVLFWWSGSTATDNNVASGNSGIGIGAANSNSSRFCLTGIANDNVTTTDTYRRYSITSCIDICTTSNATDGVMDLTSLDVDGFTLDVVDQFTSAFRVSYLALGGDDLTNIYIGNKQVPATGGNYDITGVGFRPDAIITATEGINATSGGSTGQFFGFGMATGASNQGVVEGKTDDNQAAGSSNQAGYGYNGEVNSPNPLWRSAFVSFGDDGFTLNQLQGTTAYYMFFVALKGGQYSVGDITTRTDGNDIAETVGFQPVALLFASANRALSTQGSGTNHNRISIGAGISTSNREAQAFSDEWHANPTEIANAYRNDAVYAFVQDDAIVGLMDLKSIDSNGFTCVMDDTDPSECWVTYLAIGKAPTAQTVSLNVATLSAQAQNSSASEAFTVSLNVAQLTIAIQTLTSIPGAAVELLTAASLVTQTQIVTIITGAVTIILAVAQSTTQVSIISIIPGEVNVTLNITNLSAQTPTIEIILPVIVEFGAALIVVSTEIISIHPVPFTGILDDFNRNNESPLNPDNWGGPFTASQGVWELVDNHAIPIG